MSLGSFLVTSAAPLTTLGSTTFSFLTTQFTPAGAAPDVFEAVEEELRDVGVNGARWRRVHTQFRDFQLVTTTDFATYDAGISMRRLYLYAKGAVGRLTVSLAGTNYTWRDVKILDVVPELRAGLTAGTGVTASAAAVLLATWTMRLTRYEGAQ